MSIHKAMRNTSKSGNEGNQASWAQTLFFPIIFAVLTVAILFRHQLSNHFGLLIGNRFDGLIETSLLEHWFNALKGYSRWNIVNYFYPYTDTLGYNDGFLLFGVIYSAFRCVNIDPFLSSELVNVTVRMAGFLACYLLGLRLMERRRWPAIMGAVLFTLANNANLQSAHAQIFAVCFSPVLALLLWQFATTAFQSGPSWKVVLWGSASGIFYGAWMLTSFYLAWFLSFYLLILAISFICAWIAIKPGKSLRPPVVQWRAMLIAAAATIISLIPFLLVYLPKIKETGMHPFSEALYYTPSPGDLLNLGTKNIVFGSLSDRLNAFFYPGGHGGELIIGFPPLLLLMAIAATISIWRTKSWEYSILWRLITIALMVSLVAMFKVGDKTLWHLVWEIVPGARGLRVVARNAIFLGLPIALLCAAYLGRVAVRFPALALLLSAGLIAEELSNPDIALLDRSDQLQFVDTVKSPPTRCRAFFTVEQRKSDRAHPTFSIVDNLYPQNVDAMFIAEIRHLRTINGFATFNPADWNFASNPAETYYQRVKDYSTKHNILDGLCSFNLATAAWSEKPFSQ